MPREYKKRLLFVKREKCIRSWKFAAYIPFPSFSLRPVEGTRRRQGGAEMPREALSLIRG